MTTEAEARAQAKTLPPTTIEFSDPSGSVVYAEVYDDDGLAGWVWCTVNRDRRPRAGIIVQSAKRRDPSIVFQEDLGEVTLRERDNVEVDAHEFLTYLAETRDGIGGKPSIHDVRTASSVQALRSLAGLA